MTVPYKFSSLKLNNPLAADQLDADFNSTQTNIVSPSMYVAADSSQIAVSYLTINGDLTVDGNLLVVG